MATSRGSHVKAFVCYVKYSEVCVLSTSFMYNCVCFAKKYIFGFGFIPQTSKITMDFADLHGSSGGVANSKTEVILYF